MHSLLQSFCARSTHDLSLSNTYSSLLRRFLANEHKTRQFLVLWLCSLRMLSPSHNRRVSWPNQEEWRWLVRGSLQTQHHHHYYYYSKASLSPTLDSFLEWKMLQYHTVPPSFFRICYCQQHPFQQYQFHDECIAGGLMMTMMTMATKRVVVIVVVVFADRWRGFGRPLARVRFRIRWRAGPLLPNPIDWPNCIPRIQTSPHLVDTER
mmetsp:Transcript_19653/g.29840  ORF Transcript_19653/g.29840 Transcript_19653/m.29840 type:complete len:208 (+) Transcript_19653:815-1438(+)